MASSRNIAKLDERLAEEGIIEPDHIDDYRKVHSFLNTHVRRNGKILTEENFRKGEEALREWLLLLYKKGASQDKLTSYLRVGLAHLSYDFVESNYDTIDPSDLITRTILSFKNRKFHKTFFKVSLKEASTSVRGKKAIREKAKEAARKMKKATKTRARSGSKSKENKKSPAKKVASKKIKKTASQKPAKKSQSTQKNKKSLFSFLKL